MEFSGVRLCFSLPLFLLSPQHFFMYRYDLGTRFRQKYVLRQNLFRGIPPINISDHVRVHTSNLHRTLFTASALIRGMFPSTPHFFNYYTDRLDVNMEKVDEHLRKSGQTLGIGIQVESQVTNDELFHQIKTAVSMQRSSSRRMCWIVSS